MFVVNGFLDELSPAELAHLQDLVEQFEGNWRSGNEPALVDYLPAPGSLRCALLLELVHTDLEWRLRSGLAACVGAYLRAYPELAEQCDAVLDLLETERALRFSASDFSVGSGSQCPAPALGHDPIRAMMASCTCGARPGQGRAPSRPEAACQFHPRTALAHPGRFEILELLGTGASAEVYKARDSRLDRHVALKVFRQSAFASPVERDRFLREAKSAAQVPHPHIVAIHDAGELDGGCYLVSELIQGDTLADRVKAGPLPARRSAEIAACVAETLHFAHQRGVIHRDIKPSNILLDQSGQPHVTDFGLARREGGESTLTHEGDVLGTPAYMSPEQARGEAHRVDGRSDIYSLGAVLYEMLTGEPPFRGNVRMLLTRVLEEEPPSPRRLNDQIPRDLENICLKAISKEPHARYATALAMADDLMRFLFGRPVHARPIGAIGRFGRWCRRRRTLVSLVAALFLTLASGFTGVTWEWQLARARLAETEHQRDVANIQRATAERSFAMAHQAVGDLAGVRDQKLFSYAHDTQTIGSELARKTVQYYEKLVAERGHDPSLRHELVRAYWQIGGLHCIESGTSAKVTAAWQKAESLLELLIQENPGVLSYRQEQVELCIALGQHLRRLGQPSRASDFFGMARGRLDALAVPGAGSSPDLASARNRRLLGEYYRETGAIAKAREEHERACAIWQDLYRRTPNSFFLWNMAYEKATLARALDELGNSLQALRLSQEAAQMARALIERHPQDLEYQAFLATRYHVIGNIYSDIQQLEDAVGGYRQALAIRETLARTNPNNADRWSDQAGTCEGLGEVLEQLGRGDEALAAYQGAVESMKIFLTKTPMTLKHRRGLSDRYRSVARVQRSLGQVRAAARTLLEWKALWPNQPRELCKIAWELMLCAAYPIKGHNMLSPERTVDRLRCAFLSLEIVREALASGFIGSVGRAPSLPPCEDRRKLENRTTQALITSMDRIFRTVFEGSVLSLSLELELEFQMLNLSFERLVLGHQIRDRLPSGVQLAMRGIQAVTARIGQMDQSPQTGPPEMRAMADVRASEFVFGVEAEVHERSSVNARNLADFLSADQPNSMHPSRTYAVALVSLTSPACREPRSAN
jgi:tetratricopeptide (TPR) repeat protein/tRNA A-37 threonylcarbamoyl transferase component Bud32